MDEHQPTQTAPLGQLLLQAFRWFDQSLLATLSARGWPALTQAQSMIFANLDIETGTRIAELARRIGVTRQAAHKTVAELKSLGLVELAPDPTNRSARLVKLTSDGRQNITAALQAFADIESELAGRLGDENVIALRRTLEMSWGDPAAAHDQK